MQKFDQETGLAQNRELGEDEDLMMVSGTANNTRCPITMKLVGS